MAKYRSIFYQKLMKNAIDTSALNGYYRGSSWINKLYKSQKQKTSKTTPLKTTVPRRRLFYIKILTKK